MNRNTDGLTRLKELVARSDAAARKLSGNTGDISNAEFQTALRDLSRGLTIVHELATFMQENKIQLAPSPSGNPRSSIH